MAIDDFGTGYSSLSYLKEFPVDVVKIDRGFVAGIGRSDVDEAIVAAVVALARAVHMSTVAEGVETESQLRHLTELGCDRVQGFLMAKPLTAHAFAECSAAGSSSRTPDGESQPAVASRTSTK